MSIDEIVVGVWFGVAILFVFLVAFVRGYARERGLAWWGAQVDEDVELYGVVLLWPIAILFALGYFVFNVPGHVGKWWAQRGVRKS